MLILRRQKQEDCHEFEANLGYSVTLTSPGNFQEEKYHLPCD